MDEEYPAYRGVLSCLPCFELGRWARRKLSKDDPETEPLFPSPSTVLTPPRRRPALPNLSSSSSGSPLWGSEPTSPLKSAREVLDVNGIASQKKLSKEGKEKLGSISKAYAGRMQSLQPHLPSACSTPSVPSTPRNTTSFPVLKPLSTLDGRGSSTVPTSPLRPSVPNLGRSASEPRNLSDLGFGFGFAPHQIPFQGSIHVGRGKSRRRSNTTSDRVTMDVDRSTIRGRGRSPGPARFTPVIPDNDIGEQQIVSERQRDENGIIRSMSNPVLSSMKTTEQNHQESGIHDQEGSGKDKGEMVVKRNLGLRGLNTIRGRGGKRGKTRIQSGRGGEMGKMK
ncbi:uncharacterized protein IL334_000863 [Kwoniella shivajii]|uniref:Uncharacterized protein n=1 Tax=Kwoniella shivajii TaxID=564305 RepID=A0ABZ1CTE7_9TREE|nr:hypothetical protein IL334_000863 [Kwoniella shivajii]